MAIGEQDEFVIYHDEFFAGMQETIDQQVALFDRVGGGALRIITQSSVGAFQKESFIKDISTLITRRDVTSVADATDLEMQQGEEVRVKVHRKIGPVAQTMDAFRAIGRDPSELSLRLGQMVGEKQMQDYLNTLLTALQPALAAEATNTIADTGAVLNHGDLVDGLALLGDASNDIVAWVMHSSAWHNLIKESMGLGATALATFQVGDIAVQQGIPATLGRPVLVTDSAALTDTVPTPDDFFTLGLVRDAAVIIESEQREIVTDVVTGKEQLIVRVQGEYAFNIGLKGFTWDVANGGATPTDATLATATNWDKVATSIKHLPGVMIHSQ
jgi:hypothetical protein